MATAVTSGNTVAGALTSSTDTSPHRAHTSSFEPVPHAVPPPSDKIINAKLNPLVRNWLRFLDFAMYGWGGIGGPCFIPVKHIINLQKGGTIVLCLYLMEKHDNYSLPAVLYTITHGSYGLSWLLKELVFPDPKWGNDTSILGALTISATVLLPYWLMPYMLISGKVGGEPRSRNELIAAAVVYVLGLVTMIGADCQKYFVLKAKKGLITDGFFARSRHPNYLGEMMIYGSFAYQTGTWHAAAIVGWVWTGVFLPFMLKKEASMSRYPQWAEYKKKSGFLIPKFW